MNAKIPALKALYNEPDDSFSMDPIDRAIIVETQGGLPLVPEPYHAVATKLGLPVEIVMKRFRAMQRSGAIRRIGAIPNHYALGYKANGMAVWDVVDDRVDVLGHRIGCLDFVSHCYRRPRYLPEWPYNLFVMVHGQGRPEVEQKIKEIGRLLGSDCRASDVLFSTRILKKTGVRLK
ncbi:MAG: Lrp/AsnC family transcriptional regulator [Acidiferrobacterales bacterium]